LIGCTLKAIPGFVDSIYVVDDASTDATAEEVHRVAHLDARVELLLHSGNRGVGASIVTGYRAALHGGADVVAVMDGDGQMHPDDLGPLLAPVVERRADFAKGNRFEGLRPRGAMPLARWIGNLVLSAATRIVAGFGGPIDAQCGYTAVSAAALARLPLDGLYPRYGFPNDLLFRAVELGLRIQSVPVRSVYGMEVSGIRPLEAIPRILGLLARAWLRRVVAGSSRFASVTPAGLSALGSGAPTRSPLPRKH
jgi:glycosyltransferase involved in cell wall biosynthesis